MRLLSALLCCFFLACLPQAITPDYAAQREQAIADAMGKPSHAPATPEEWSAAEAGAEQSARLKESEKVEAPVRLTSTGYSLEHRFGVQGGKCYAAGLGWSFPSETVASVLYQPREDGKPVNDSVGGARERLQPNAGALTFCADRDGEAILSLSTVKPDGTAAMNELHEYAFVLASRTETAAQASARRAVDAQRGSAAKARMDANIADAEARRARNLAERCSRCREDFRLCQVQAAAARKYPSRNRGVTYTTSCEQQFGVCATGKYSGTAEEMAQCGAPPQ